MTRTIVLLSALATITAISACDDPVSARRRATAPSYAPRVGSEDESSSDANFAEHSADVAEREVSAREGAVPVAAMLAERRRVLQRWRWESTGEAVIASIPSSSSDEAEATGLLRIAGNESSWNSSPLSDDPLGDARDMIGIWQVARAIRSRSCDRARVRKITECDESGETMLSAMRRLSSRVMGARAPSSHRQRYYSEVELDCEQPPSYRERQPWGDVLRPRCLRAARIARDLVAGAVHRVTPIGVTPIAWGRRCEVCSDPADSSTCELREGVCDSSLGCDRGLRRISLTGTRNALWCRPGVGGCPHGRDPICDILSNTSDEQTDYSPEMRDEETAPPSPPRRKPIFRPGGT